MHELPKLFSGKNKENISKYYPLKKTGFDISCKLPPMEAVCMNCQSLFSGKNKKNISKYYLLKKTGFDISCKLPPKEAVCMNCQSLFSGKK